MHTTHETLDLVYCFLGLVKGGPYGFKATRRMACHRHAVGDTSTNSCFAHQFIAQQCTPASNRLSLSPITNVEHSPPTYRVLALQAKQAELSASATKKAVQLKASSKQLEKLKKDIAKLGECGGAVQV